MLHVIFLFILKLNIIVYGLQNCIPRHLIYADLNNPTNVSLMSKNSSQCYRKHTLRTDLRSHFLNSCFNS